MSRLGIETEIQKKQVIALEHEIELLKTLQHRNIVKYLGTANTKQSINIFLEFVGGGSLQQIYRRYRMGESLIRRYSEHILCGIEYLHFNNLIHRDIKSANILVELDGTCKLADFGGSKKCEVGQNAS